MNWSLIDDRRRRGRIAQCVVAVVLGTLMVGFFRAQVARRPDQALTTPGSRPHAVVTPPARGVILDREGRVLAGNTTTYRLSILPGPSDSVRATLQRVASILGLSDEDVAMLSARHARAVHQVLDITTDAPADAVTRINELRSSFPWLLIEARPRRSYPDGPAIAHLVGHLDAGPGMARSTDAYEARRPAGHSGIEAEYEAVLAGSAGLRYVEVDRDGRVVDAPASAPWIGPVGGGVVKLTVDQTLQLLLRDLLPDSVRAGVAMIEAPSGAVLALYSSPSFDPNAVAGPGGPDILAALRADPAEPLLNRAVGRTYRIGRLWQLVTAATAMQLGVVTGEGTMPLGCRGGMPYRGRYLHCHDRRGHGALGLADALKAGCDVYFYQLGLQLGLDRLVSEGVRAGFGRPTGIDLPGERAGGIRIDIAGEPDLDGEELAALVAAGAGSVEASPLQLAHFYAALLTPGGSASPRVRRFPELQVGKDDGLDPGMAAETRGLLRAGLRRVDVPDEPVPDGLPEHWEWLGSGVHGVRSEGVDHAWFVGLAGPAQAPMLAIAVVVEGTGPDPAGIAAQVAGRYFRLPAPTSGAGAAPNHAAAIDR